MSPLQKLAGRASRLVDALINLDTPTVCFDGPLYPGPVCEGTVDPVPAPQATAPAAGVRATSPGYGTRPWVGARLMAWDCLYDDDPDHECRDRDGGIWRAGKCCWESAKLMSRHDFPTAHPDLYQKAVRLRILVPDEQPEQVAS